MILVLSEQALSIDKLKADHILKYL